MTLELVALVLAAIFSGAAIYVSVVENPARLAIDDRAALAEWQPSYRRGAVMQASLAMLVFAAGMACWWQTKNLAFLAGAGFAILPWPWTLLVIKPTNNALLAMDVAAAGPQSRALIQKWGALHLGRTALGIAATISYCLGVMNP